MKQILHIFRKDVRRHWPEILISLAFLGLYVWVTLRTPERNSFVAGDSSWVLPWISVESIPPLMVVFWIFLAVRLVQGESLVGDRQWWVTKPYEWWKLLAAKLSFFIVFISLPLFLVQMYLLHHAGFPALSNLRGVLYMQLSLGWVLFVTSTALGCLTKNLWQAALAVVGAVVAAAVVTELLQKIPDSSMSYWVGRVGYTAIGPITTALVIGTIGWQYARRRTWASRGLLVTTAILYFLPSVLTPYTKLVEKKYPLVDSSAAPVLFAPVKIPPSEEPPKKPRYPMPLSEDVSLGIPLSVSGIAPGRFVRIDGVRPYIEPPNAPKIDLGWNSYASVEWPNQQSGLMFAIKRSDFNNLKSQPVSLQFELALTEFEETQARELTLGDGKFWDKSLGFCHLDERDPSGIDCAQAFASSPFVATFDPPAGQCEVPENEKNFFENRTSHAEQLSSISSALLNPVENYQIPFGVGGWSWDYGKNTPPVPKRIYLCPGVNVRLAVPEEKRHVRIKMQLDGIRLEDFTNKRFDWD